MITAKRAQALQIVRDQGSLAPREFARQMWPDSPGWRRVSKCGPYGSTRGGGMCLAGGSYLGKLRRASLVEKDASDPRGLYSISEEGRRQLAAWKKQEAERPKCLYCERPIRRGRLTPGSMRFCRCGAIGEWHGPRTGWIWHKDRDSSG